MKILMATSEAAPLAKSGGLADAVSALAIALARAGHDVRVVLPRYYSIDRASLKALPLSLAVPMGWGEERAAVYETVLPGSAIPVWLLDHEVFFGRDGIYGDKASPDFPDNPARFSFLSRAVFPLCRAMGFEPDILHAHDWPTALAPVYLHRIEWKLGGFEKTASVFSIHNLGYQGLYPKDSFSAFGLPWELYHGAGFEHYGRINLLKAGLTEADVLTTVSPTYAREVQTPEYGVGLDGLLRGRSQDFVGILNGVDLGIWDPTRDPLLPAHYSAEDLGGKAACKAVLQRAMGLPEDPAVPLIGMVTRLTDQKGVGELFGPLYGSAWKICTDMVLQFAVLGSGERWCEDELRSLSARLPNFRARVGYDEGLAHLIEAGADFFLMPSRYEPCGLNQMYSLRYGTLPIVRRTGGLADTVENYDEQSGAGTGFMFDDLSPRSIYDTTGWAVWAWYNKPEHIDAMRRRAMGRSFSWERSAAEYERLYGRALEVARDRR